MTLLSRFPPSKRDKIVQFDTTSAVKRTFGKDPAGVERGKGQGHGYGGRAMSATTTPIAAQPLPPPPAPAAEIAAEPALPPAWDRLESQIRWYGGHARSNKRWYLRIKVVQIVAAAVIPVIAAADLAVWVAGALGALVVVLESVQQLFQFHSNWTSYRSTSEALKHEKFLYVAKAGAYATAKDPAGLLAERIEGRVSQEHAAWASEQQHQQKSGGQES
jgi:hypothetical protein